MHWGCKVAQRNEHQIFDVFRFEIVGIYIKDFLSFPIADIFSSSFELDRNPQDIKQKRPSNCLKTELLTLFQDIHALHTWDLWSKELLQPKQAQL